MGKCGLAENITSNCCHALVSCPSLEDNVAASNNFYQRNQPFNFILLISCKSHNLSPTNVHVFSLLKCELCEIKLPFLFCVICVLSIGLTS